MLITYSGKGWEWMERKRGKGKGGKEKHEKLKKKSICISKTFCSFAGSGWPWLSLIPRFHNMALRPCWMGPMELRPVVLPEFLGLAAPELRRSSVDLRPSFAGLSSALVAAAAGGFTGYARGSRGERRRAACKAAADEALGMGPQKQKRLQTQRVVYSNHHLPRWSHFMYDVELVELNFTNRLSMVDVKREEVIVRTAGGHWI
eukprot:symbB.v1.2.024024.t1/scaffold2204.1/size85845/2